MYQLWVGNLQKVVDFCDDICAAKEAYEVWEIHLPRGIRVGIRIQFWIIIA